MYRTPAEEKPKLIAELNFSIYTVDLITFVNLCNLSNNVLALPPLYLLRVIMQKHDI